MPSVSTATQDPLLGDRGDATRTRDQKAGPQLTLELRRRPPGAPGPRRPLESAGGPEGADARTRAPTDAAFSDPGLERAKGSSRVGSARGAALRPRAEQWDERARAGLTGVQGGGGAGAPVPASVSLPPPAASHAASRCRSRAELISTTSTYRSLARCQAGRHGASGSRGAPGRVGQGGGGRGTPHPGSTEDTVQKEGPGGAGGGWIVASPARGGRDSVGLGAKGALPPRPHPLLLIKAKNKEAAGEGGFDLTPPSQF